MPNWYARAYFASFLAILILLLLYYGGHTLEKNLQKPMPRGDITLRYGHDDLLEINGKKYRRCKDVTAVLLLGVDSPNETEISPYRSGGQADFLYLLIIDNNENASAGFRSIATPLPLSQFWVYLVMKPAFAPPKSAWLMVLARTKRSAAS